MVHGASKRGRWLVPVLVATLLSSAAPAFGQDSRDDLARRHFESGVAYLQESDYENALKAFDKAYELSKRPEILLNIATVNERKADLPAAVASLEQYLKVAPESTERGTVEARIANLKKRIEEAAAQPSTAPTPDGQPSTQGPTPDRGPTAEPASDLPAYILLGVGGLAAVGAGVTGFMAKGKYDDAKDECSPSCSDDDLSSSKTLAWTSTALTGVALVSAGIGAVLLLTKDPARESVSEAHAKSGAMKRGGGTEPRSRWAPKPRWQLGLGVTPGGAAASAHWRF